LSLQQNHFSDRGLGALNGKNTLKRLHLGLGSGRITDAGLVHLNGFAKLEVVDLQNSQVTALGLQHLKALPSLKELWLSGTGIRMADAQSLQETMPTVKLGGLR
jgi:hypothetical protein